MKFFRLPNLIFFLMLFIATAMSSRLSFENSKFSYKNLFNSNPTLEFYEEISNDLEENDIEFIDHCFLFNFLSATVFSICLILSYFYITPKSLIFGFTNLPPPSI